jgi:hypothetical protein
MRRGQRESRVRIVILPSFLLFDPVVCSSVQTISGNFVTLLDGRILRASEPIPTPNEKSYEPSCQEEESNRGSA